MRTWRHPLGRAITLGVLLGTAGALIGYLVGRSNDADWSSSVAWGLYITGGLLLFLGSAPSIAPPPGHYLAATMPEAARAMIEQRQKSRIAGAPWMLLNFLVAASLIGIGALFEIYG
jgi:hypothetical protein